MQNVTGNPVDGDDFVGRADELRQLQGAVEAGNHVLLVVASRRWWRKSRGDSR